MFIAHPSAYNRSRTGRLGFPISRLGLSGGFEPPPQRGELPRRGDSGWLLSLKRVDNPEIDMLY